MQDVISEEPERFFIAEFVREQIFQQYYEEIPYCCTVSPSHTHLHQTGIEISERFLRNKGMLNEYPSLVHSTVLRLEISISFLSGQCAVETILNRIIARAILPSYHSSFTTPLLRWLRRASNNVWCLAYQSTLESEIESKILSSVRFKWIKSAGSCHWVCLTTWCQAFGKSHYICGKRFTAGYHHWQTRQLSQETLHGISHCYRKLPR